MSDEKRVITTTRTLALIKDLLKDETPVRYPPNRLTKGVSP